MKTPDFTNNWNYRGKDYTFLVYFTNSFEGLEKVSQSYGIVYDDNGKVLIVSQDGVEWNFPGGGIEKGEDFRKALVREVYEEGAVVIEEDSIKPFFYQEVLLGEELEGVQVRSIARVKEVHQFVNDPGGGTKFQKFIDYTDIPKYIKWSGVENLITERIKDHLNN
jgi:8-oxo-dGTP pyrophosphatase MutT (NUDIX family)